MVHQWVFSELPSARPSAKPLCDYIISFLTCKTYFHRYSFALSFASKIAYMLYMYIVIRTPVTRQPPELHTDIRFNVRLDEFSFSQKYMLFAGWEVTEVTVFHYTIRTDPKPVNNLFIFSTVSQITL